MSSAKKPINYKLFWEQIFGNDVLSESFLYAVGKIAAAANLSYHEYERVSKSFDCLNTYGTLNKENFVFTFNLINGEKSSRSFKDSLLRVDTVLGDIINNTPYLNPTSNTKRPILQNCQYYIFGMVPHYLFLFECKYNMISSASSIIGYDNNHNQYTCSIGGELIADTNALKFIDKITHASKKCKTLYGYNENIYHDLWDKIMGDVDSVSIDTAFEKFTGAIIGHKEYKKGDEKAVEYIILWLQTSEHEKFIIQCSDFFSLWENFGRYTAGGDSSYIGTLAKLLENIFKCQGFVNSYKINNLPPCYFCLSKSRSEDGRLIFEYIGDNLKMDFVGIIYDDRGFVLRNRGIFLYMQDIHLLVKILKLAVSRTSKCQNTPSLYVPKNSIITHSNDKFYLKRPESTTMEELGDICDVAAVFSRTVDSQCDVLKSITSSYGTIMHAPWNNININVPVWFDALSVNTNYAEDYKNPSASSTPYIDEVSIIKSQLINYIETEFEFKVHKLIKDTRNFLISKKTDSLLPYLIYLAYGIYTAVIEINNAKQITISGYNALGNRIYEKYTISKSNIEKIVSLMNKLNKYIYYDKLADILLDFYFFEDDEFYSTGSMDIKINIIKSILRKHGFPERK